MKYNMSSEDIALTLESLKGEYGENAFNVALGVPGKGRETAMQAVLDTFPSAKVGEGMIARAQEERNE